MKVWFEGSHTTPEFVACSYPRFFQNALQLLVFFLLLDSSETARGVIEGDVAEFGSTEIFINGVFIREDGVTPMLRMNSVRRFDTLNRNAFPVELRDPLKVGDTIAVRTYSSLPEKISHQTPVGEIVIYDGWSGLIAAFDDGTLTNEKWKCAGHEDFGGIVRRDDVDEGRWFQVDFNDEDWAPAHVQNISCCPWRDQERIWWSRLNAKWISPPPNVNNSIPREYFCRYKVKPPGGLMDGSLLKASASAPKMNVIELELSQHVGRFRFNVSRDCDVTCGLLDPRFELRVPSMLELLHFGVTGPATVTEMVWFDVTGGFMHRRNSDPDGWSTVADLEACKRVCEQSPDCGAIDFCDSGPDPATGHNCKIMPFFNESALNSTVMTERYFHMIYVAQNATPEIFVSDKLSPGTYYWGYCMTRDPVTGEHSTWAAVEATRTEDRTKLCFDCGQRQPPNPQLLGGYASRNKIAVIMKSNSPGRVFCAARDMTAYGLDGGGTPQTIDEIREEEFYNLIFIAGGSVPVEIVGLKNGTLYEVSCFAETEDGTPSSDADLELHRRMWRTENHNVIIDSLVIQEEIVTSSSLVEKVMITQTRVVSIGYLWCKAFNLTYMSEYAVPTAEELELTGLREKIEDFNIDGGGMFTGLDINITYEVYCTGRYDDFSNESDTGAMQSPMWVDVGKREVLPDRIILTLGVRAPARQVSLYCRGFRWSYQPYTQRPPIPTFAEMRLPPSVKMDIETIGGGNVKLTLTDLDPGSLYDVYCFAEEMAGFIPPGAQPPPLATMNDAAFIATRGTIRTMGPEFRDGGWSCIAGKYCGIHDVRGVRLSPDDKLVAREGWCRGRCQCSGQEDIKRKGASCSDVSHFVDIHNEFPNGDTDALDPNGAWCYVDPGLCQDQQPSPVFPERLISYVACSFNKVVTREGAGPIGFPNGGVARMLSSDGTAFDFGAEPLDTLGAALYLCWCNGTTSSCQTEYDYNLHIGNLYMSGPRLPQNQSTEVCVANRPCKIFNFFGEAVSEGNRLVVVPVSPAGCRWKPATAWDLTYVPGFPNKGVSEPAYDHGYNYSWGEEPLRAEGGVYQLCWCGEVDIDGNALCPNSRPINGDGFTVGAGLIRVIGPEVGSSRDCSVGFECIVANVPGTGLQGGDRMSVQKVCGQPDPQPANWEMGLEADSNMTANSNTSTNWLEGGWLLYDPRTADSLGLEFGSPTDNSSHDRGTWGMPRRSISVANERPGYYAWEAPSVALPGIYSLCWCPSGWECSSAMDFKVMMGRLDLYGPLVYPAASQSFICVRTRQCKVVGLQGYMPPGGSVLMVGGGPCGTSPPAKGFPRDGISTSSRDSSSFSWGSDPVAVPPGRYRLCWCRQNCFTADAFQAFVGVLRVKSPSSFFTRQWVCGLNVTCTIDHVEGEALNSGDSIAVMAVCGEQKESSNFEQINGRSVATGHDGSWFTLPPAYVAGMYRVCWCASEVLCRYGYEYDIDIGSLLVGGANSGALYSCYEWYECSIDGLLGTFLSNGDRLRVVPADTGCTDANGVSVNGTTMPRVFGFPLGGLSYPATEGGTRFSFGSERVRSQPGIYDLCWCSGTLSANGVCDENGPFNLPAGSIRIGTAKEYNFINKAPEPEERSSDNVYIIILAVTVPCIALLVGFFGWRRISHETARKVNQDPIAANPFAIEKSKTAKSQEKAKLEYAVKNVRTLRILALGGMPGQAIFSLTKDADVNSVNIFKPQSSPRGSKAQITDSPAAKLRALADVPANKDLNRLLNRAHTAVVGTMEDSLPGRPQFGKPEFSPTMSMAYTKSLTFQQPKAPEDDFGEDDVAAPTIDAPRMHLRQDIRDILDLPPLPDTDDQFHGSLPWSAR